MGTAICYHNNNNILFHPLGEQLTEKVGVE